jgi:hypothetical protein
MTSPAGFYDDFCYRTPGGVTVTHNWFSKDGQPYACERCGKSMPILAIPAPCDGCSAKSAEIARLTKALVAAERSRDTARRERDHMLRTVVPERDALRAEVEKLTKHLAVWRDSAERLGQDAAAALAREAAMCALAERWLVTRSSYDPDRDGRDGNYVWCRDCGRITDGDGPVLHRKTCESARALAAPSGPGTTDRKDGE